MSVASTELLARYRDLRDQGASAMVRREAYNDWFRQCCAEGHSPSALRIHSRDEVERFWARTVSGPEGHLYWTGGKWFRRNDGKMRSPQRWVWAHTHGPLGHYTEIEVTCAEPKCVNVEHMRVRPRSERRVLMSDERLYGAVQVLAMRLGRTPTSVEWDASKQRITYSAVKMRFGTWGDFCRKAGLKPRRRGERV